MSPETDHIDLKPSDSLSIGYVASDDFAIRLAFRQLYRKRRDPSPATILRHARCWQPWRSVASWYLWRHLDTP